MTRRILLVTFADEHGLLSAVRALRAEGRPILDVRAPYPVHGLPEAQGLAPSRLPWVTFWGGLAGLAFGLLLQAWTSAVDWPLNVGGKPLFSWPAFVPVAFELVVLFAGLSTVLAFLVVDRRRTATPAPGACLRATDDRFLLALAAEDATYDASTLGKRMSERFGAVGADEVVVEDAS
jgi:hypothetical protein